MLLILVACSKENNEDTEPFPKIALSVVTPTISDNDKNGEITRSRSTTDTQRTQMIEVKASNGMTMEATLEKNNVTTRTTTALANGTKYRIIAFKCNDISTTGYISYADYAAGITGAIAGELHVPADDTYTFVCYSLNSTNLPIFDRDMLNITIDTATDNLLYTKFNQAITSGSKTLSFSLTPKLSQIIVIADATNIEKNITAISATLSPNYSVLFALGTGALTAGVSAERIIPWGNIVPAQTVTSTPCTVFTNASTAVSISIPSITIGGTTKANLSASFSGNVMQPGNKYTLRLNLYRAGILAAGIIWAPGNLIKSGNKYSFAATQEYYSGVWDGGDYWNWCSLDPTDYINHATTYSTTVDPCQKVAPTSTWRIPTAQELADLMNLGSIWSTKNSVNGRYFGISNIPTIGSEDNYVFLPAAGTRFNGSKDNMAGMGVNGRYWSAENPTVDANGRYWGYDIYFRDGSIRGEQYPSNNGYPIRCVNISK